ncbi:consortin, connexin sorting protein b isoform X2 [Danio rerio]|uniref:Consortin, connexin sorting protein b isoform X2 n=1 Tax=Danio rerio TaxID=7955 RepID=A0AC58I464_DANRE
MGESESRKSVRWKETSGINKASEDMIISYLTVSDENQNKLPETEVMNAEDDTHELKNINPEERCPANNKSQSCSGDHKGLPGILAPGPSPSLLASLHALVEHNDHMLLPHSLHQIAEGYFLEEDYKWAVEFLHLEKLYHERLLSNLASVQEKWEAQRKMSDKTESNSPLVTNGAEKERERMEVLSHICRTHKRPNLSVQKNMEAVKLQTSPTHETESKSKQEQASVNQISLEAECEPEDDGEFSEEEEEEDEGLEEDECWNEELQEDTELQTPVDELDNLIQVEEMFPSNGLVSILKKKICIKEVGDSEKDSSKRKVRFREPDNTFEQAQDVALLQRVSVPGFCTTNG